MPLRKSKNSNKTNNGSPSVKTNDTPQNTTAVGLRSPSPATISLYPYKSFTALLNAAEDAEDDHLMPSQISQQNNTINTQTDQIRPSLLDLWQEELRKTKALEAKLQETDEKVRHYRNLYRVYEERTVNLEDMVDRRGAVVGEGGGGATAEEGVGSSFVRTRGGVMKTACVKCGRLPATMVWFPCRHLSVCLVCENKISVCAICGVPKTGSLNINN